MFSHTDAGVAGGVVQRRPEAAIGINCYKLLML